MKNLLKKVLTLVSALALLVSSTAMVYAEEEQTEAPVAEASDINAEAEALAAQQAEEAARIAAEEAAKKAAEEEAARIAAEEAAKKAAEEEAARIAAEEAAKKAAEEEAARIAAEEAAKQSEEVPSDNNNEETLSEEEEDSEDGEIVELSDDWGYVDPEIIADYVPEVTVELKYPDIRELKINEKLSGAIDAENDAEMFIRCGGNKTIVLGLYASSENVAVEINGNAVNFTKAEPAAATTDFYSTYELKVAAGREYTIILSSSTPVSYKITADDAAKQTVTEETVKDETAVTEEAETQETENNEAAAENTEAAAAEETETTEATEETENTEEAEAASEENTEETSGEEGIEGSDTEENTEAETTEEEVPAVKGWITVDKETFEIGDTITLTANADIELENMVAWQTKVQNAEEWTGAGYGETLTVELTEENINNSYRFRMEDESYSEEYTLTAKEIAAEETEADGEETNSEEAVGEKTEEIIEGMEVTTEETDEAEAETVATNWISTDAESFEIGTTIVLTANTENEMEEPETRILWQTKGPESEEWTDLGFGASLTVEITEDNINNIYRFVIPEEAVSAEFALIKADDAEIEDKPFELSEDRTVSFVISWDEDEEVHTFGSVAHFDAILNGYEGVVYTVQWQQSEDGQNWTDIEEAVEEHMDLVITPENYNMVWRVVVYPDLEATQEAMAETAQD